MDQLGANPPENNRAKLGRQTMLSELQIYKDLKNVSQEYLYSPVQQDKYLDFLCEDMRHSCDSSTKYRLCDLCFRFASKKRVGEGLEHNTTTVSYTHLTLPTIYSV